ncbi:MAG: ABC transporter permease [Thermoleophilia bacterium]|nr:ABC transporter permease [Thermoleophilia bacterium]
MAVRSLRAGGVRPGARRVNGYLVSYEHQFLLYLRNWQGSLFSNFAQPVLFLLAMGVGLGSYVDKGGSGATGGVPYLQFLAPALLVSSVMQGAAGEGTFPVLSGFRWVRRYHAMYATPLSPYAIAFGQLAWTATHALMVGGIFCVVIILFGAAASPGILWSVPIGLLTGVAFSAPIAAFMSTQRDTGAWNNIWRFGITPLFLFSGTFFPIDRLPELIRPVAWLLPLWHGVDLARSLALGTAGEDPLVQIAHVVILAAFAVGGSAAMFVMFRRQLER